MSETASGFSVFDGMVELPVVRQIGLLIGLSLSIALGVSIFNWAKTPEYRVLYGNLNDRESAQIVDELQRQSIPFILHPTTGAIMTPDKYIHDARLNLARAGLPKNGNPGIELLQNSGPFGNSEIMEVARFQHALEDELARSIQSINTIKNARIHLAIPKQSAFLRDNQKPTASVLVNMYPGHSLNDMQVIAIRNMVAAGVANLDKESVSIIDQDGELLSSNNDKNGFGLNGEQFNQTHRLEEIYISRIENLLSPIIGPGGVRAQVVIEMDFTVTEQAHEIYNPDSSIVRSEQIHEERTFDDTQIPSGVAGAQSNLAPEAAIADPQNAVNASTPVIEANIPSDETLDTTRNYEIGKTVSHTRAAPGKIERITAAIVVNNKQTIDEDGKISKIALSEEEMTRITTLIKEAIGYKEERGDSVHITNALFIESPDPEPLPEPSLLEQPWIWSVGKIALSTIGVLLFIFGVLRPVMRSLAVRPLSGSLMLEADGITALPYNSNQSGRQRLSYEEELSAAKAIVHQDPKRVAQVVKTWVASDA